MLNVAYTVDILHQDGDPGEVTVSTKVDEDSGEATASTKVDESSGDVAASNTVVERHPVSTMDGDQTLEMISNSVAEADRGATGADLEDLRREMQRERREMQREISQLRRLVVNQGK